MKREFFKITEQDGGLAVYQEKTGQYCNPHI